MKKAVLNMEPFTCPSCIKKIETTLLKTDGVKAANVLFNASRVRLEYDSSITSIEAMADVVTRLGYRVLSTKAVSQG
ncbi:MAG TPA: heavy-metal-associated domain-containing protein [Candidimonas sp.]|nr:heavy-metal-associated domain-containing protein [Candidimonas sp.]